MCLHMFIYYPRMERLHSCGADLAPEAWARVMNTTVYVEYFDLSDRLCLYLDHC